MSDAPEIEAPDLRFAEVEADAWVDRSTWSASWRARAEREPRLHIVGAANGHKDALSTGETPGPSSWVMSRTTHLLGTLGTNQAVPCNPKVAGNAAAHIPKERNRSQGEVSMTTPTTRTAARTTTRTAARTGVLAALVLAVGLLATPPVSAQSSAAPAPPGTVTLVPAASTAIVTSRPPNGTILYAGISGGLGRLTIKNGPSQDGVVTLVRGRSKAISVYLRARSSTTVRNIKPGTYTIYYTTGSPFSFSIPKGRFTRGATYWRFNDRLRFAAPPRYTIGSLTLYAVSNGNAPTTQIPPGDYP